MIRDGHLDRHLRRCRGVYARRRRLLWDGLGATLPAGYTRLPAVAGLHIAVVAPGLGGEPLAHTDVRYSELGRCYAAEPVRDGFLLGFAGIPTALLPEAIKAFSGLLRHSAPELRGQR